MKQFTIILWFFFCFESYGQVLDNVPCATNSNTGAGFNWTAQTFPCYIIGYPSNQIESPFYAFSLNNPNIHSFATNTVKDFLPTEGWEYLQGDFGTAIQPVSHPYLILYNKNSGLLRIFIAVTQLFGQNDNSTITLRYLSGSKRSAVLEHLTPSRIRNALDNYNNNIPKSIQNNYFANTTPFWLHADFIMNYDPCTCNYRSDLFFEATLSSTATLAFKLNGNAVQTLDNYGRGGVNGKSSLSNILFPGVSFWKNAESGMNFINNLKYDTDKYPNILSYVTGIGRTMSAVDFLVGLFSPTKPTTVTPLSFKMNFTADGTISYVNPYKPISLNTPGSYQATVASSAIPNYNNSMGVFTLIKTPLIKRYQNAYSQVTGYCSYNDNYTMSYEYSDILKLAEPIKYAINPNAGISLNPADIDIRLNWVFFSDGTLFNTVFGESDVYNAGCFGEYEMYCDGREEWDCEGNYTLTENGYHTVVSGVPALKVTAKLKTLSSGQDFLFTAIYKCSQIGGAASDFTFDITPGSNNEHIPSATTCSNNFIPQATTAEIKAVCNSTAYITKVNQYSRINTDSVKEEIPKTKINSNTFVLSPNPASSYTNSLINVKANTKVKILIYDITGRFIKQLFNGKLQEGTYNLRNDLLSLTNGTYLVSAEFDDQRITQKLILQK